MQHLPLYCSTQSNMSKLDLQILVCVNDRRKIKKKCELEALILKRGEGVRSTLHLTWNPPLKARRGVRSNLHSYHLINFYDHLNVSMMFTDHFLHV